MSVNFNITTNAATVAKNLGAGTKEMMDKLPFILRAMVVLIIRDLLDKSLPILGNDPRGQGGNTNAAKDQGDENLEKEINRAFTTWDNTKIGDLIMAKNEAVLWNLANPIQWRSARLKRAWDKQDIDELYKAFKAAGWEENPSLGTFVNEPTIELHNSMRDPQTGRIKDEIVKNPQLRVSVRDRQAIEAFIIQRQLSVGKMAGGWVKALSALGHKVQTPFGNNGSGSASISSDGLRIRASNKYGDFNSIISNNNILNEVIRENTETIKTTLQREVDAILLKYATPSGGPTSPPVPPSGGGTP